MSKEIKEVQAHLDNATILSRSYLMKMERAKSLEKELGTLKELINCKN